jgi:hypothetical protein
MMGCFADMQVEEEKTVNEKRTILDEQWLDTAGDIPQETVENEQVGYPYIQWVNGNRQLKAMGGVPYTGGWALPVANIDAEQLPGWERGELTHGETSTDVWFRRDITVSVIRSRKAWAVYDGQTTRMYPWNQYDAAKVAGKPRGKLQVLCYVKGLEEQGPHMLTLRGSFARAFTDNVVASFSKYVIGAANKENARRGVKAKFPYRAFWLTVGPDRDSTGDPRFTEVGTKPANSLVVLPVSLGIDAKMTMADIGKLFVGKELLAVATVTYTEAESWANALEQAQPIAGAAEPEPTTEAGAVEEIPF